MQEYWQVFQMQGSQLNPNLICKLLDKIHKINNGEYYVK
jgi:hypothetical protein